MNKYILITKKLIGYLVFEYSRKTGHLVKFENCTYQMTVEQQKHLMKELQYCRHNHSFVEWANDRGHIIMHIPEDLSFERFWADYDYQRNKIGAERYWKRLSDEDKRYVFMNMAAYKRYCKMNLGWYNQKYPDGYLSPDKKLYLSEWDKLTDKKKD